MVYDKVWTVIPKDIRHELSRETQEHAEAIPNSFGTLSPVDSDKSLGKVSLDRLDKAFEQIKERKTRAGKKNEIVLTINKRNFDISIDDYSFLHYDKFNREVYALLKKHNLCSSDVSSIYRIIGGSKDFLPVDSVATNIIMSNLADNMARRKGLNTITDQNIAFLVTSLNSLEGRSPLHLDSRDWLISSVIKFEIPSDIQFMSLNNYKILRKSYADMRFAFHNAIASLNSVFRLDRIDDMELLRDKVNVVMADLDKEIIDYKKTGFGKKVLRWITFSVGNLFALGGIAAGLTGNRILSATGASAAVGFRFIDRAIEIRNIEGDKGKLVRMLAGIQKDIIKDSDVRKLI
jgi:hypothetical protein